MGCSSCGSKTQQLNVRGGRRNAPPRQQQQPQYASQIFNTDEGEDMPDGIVSREESMARRESTKLAVDNFAKKVIKAAAEEGLTVDQTRQAMQTIMASIGNQKITVPE